MSSRTRVAGLLALVFGVPTTGCLQQTLADAGLSAARGGSRSANTLQDFDVGRTVIEGGVGQVEAFHALSPDNLDGLFLLTKGWTSIGAAFIEDDLELARTARNDELEEQQRLRARAAYARARYFGIQMIERYAEGFPAARKNADTLHSWLERRFYWPEDADALLWAGTAWIAHVGVSTDIPEVVGELYVGVELVRRSVELDPTVEFGLGEAELGTYHAMLKDPRESIIHFNRALALGRGKYLATKVNLAQYYYCSVGDRARYESTLKAVLAEGDPLPDARFQNTVAKRKARRYLSDKVWQEECAFSLAAR